MPNVVIYHNPRCSKSRQSLQLLRDHGVEPTVVEYLQTPPSADELAKILQLLGLTPRELMRTKEADYRDNRLDDPSLTDSALIDAMVKHPILIERPIVVHDNKAVIGRPPENTVEIL